MLLIVAGLGLDATGVAETGGGVHCDVKLSAGRASGRGLGLVLGQTTHEHARGEDSTVRGRPWCLWLVDAHDEELLDAGCLGVSCPVYSSVCVSSSLC